MAERFLYDALSTLGGGVNSDLAPVLLDAQTAAWMVNATVRGGFPRPRPPRFKRTLNFPSVEVGSAIQNGLFQGARYYRPDAGPQQLVAQISGRLFTFTPLGNEITVAEITIPGDPNDASTAQVWMNQAEKWLIITDGSSKNPIFWDGVTARRSAGPSQLLAIGTAFNPGTPPPIGEVVEVTLDREWTYGYGITVLMNGAFYRATNSSSPTPTFDAVFKPGLLPGAPITFASGATVTVDPSVVGFCYSTGQSGTTYYIRVVTGSYVPLTGTIITVAGYSLQITGVVTPGGFDGGSANTNTYELRAIKTPASPVPVIANILGQYVFRTTSEPSVQIATLTAGFTLGVFQSSATADISNEYTGAAGQTVFITDTNGVLRLLTIEPGTPSTPSTVFLVNVDDVSPDAYDATEDILSVPEIPAGRMGAYVLGHQAQCLIDGQSFIYGDVVGGPSGSEIYNYRDAVLKTTENDFLELRGSFRLPGAETISSMTTTAVLDASYGQGPLQIGTPTSIFTCAVPTDADAFAVLTNPIVTQALIGKGPQAQNSTLLANSDTLFRQVDGFGSLIYGRRDFETWGNTPISTEVERALRGENKGLLSYGSAITFDNRFLANAELMTSPRGVFGDSSVVLNFDPVSSLRGKAPSIWEGVWTDGNVLQYLTGIFDGVERAWQFTYNPTSLQIELWEQLRSDSTEVFDNGTDRITWEIETPCIFKPESRSPEFPIIRLNNGKIHIDEVVGNVEIRVQYRPDYSPTWVDWITLNVTDAAPDGYKTPLGLGTPSVDSCSTGNNRPSRSGRFFQIRFQITGQCVLMASEFQAVPEPTVTWPAPVCN